VSPAPASLISSVSDGLRALLETIRDFGRRERISVALVGGAVRDLLLEEPVRDVDLVWEGAGDPGRVARLLGVALGSDVTYHPLFLTASLTVPSGVRVDFGRARAECYSTPAALPAVRPASLDEDLSRRDFSINAMAIDLGRPAVLIDPGTGAADLRARLLRVLHSASFRDDPTRILRGCELAVRRRLEFEPETASQAAAAIYSGFLMRLSGTRVRHELARLFGAPSRAVAGAAALRALGADRALHSEFRIEEAGISRLEMLAGWSWTRATSETPFWVVALSALMWHRPAAARSAVATWLGLKRSQRRWLESGPERLSPLLGSEGALDLTEETMADQMLQLSTAEAGFVHLLANPERAEALEGARRLAEMNLRIGGADLLAAGAAPGPRVGEALAATLAARRRGDLAADEELAFALDWLRRKESGDAAP